jgi:hypothetical protein
LQEIAAQQEQERLREAIKLEEERREREETEKKIVCFIRFLFEFPN